MSDDEEEDIERRFTILYGSQTGNAQDVAERISRQARRRRIKTSIFSMDEYDISNLIEEPLIVFVISTTGNGDFPTPSLPFWRFLLRSNLQSDVLSDVTFITFGLGDSSYARYCWSSRKLNKRLKGLGAEELIEGGEADDQHYLGIEGTLRPWLDKLWDTLEEVLPPMSQGERRINDDEMLPPRIRISLSKQQNGYHANGSASTSKEMLPGWRMARISKMERMTCPDHWQDVRLVEFEDENGQSMRYDAGDVVAMLPENADEDVERLLRRMGWSQLADSPLSLQTSDTDHQISPMVSMHKHLTLRHMLKTCIDFNGVPRPSFFEQLIPFTPKDHMQREKLEEFCTPGEGADEMYEYAIRVRRTILETLEEFDSVEIPIEYLLEIFPLMQRREFSIASGPSTHPTSVQLAIAMVSYKTRLKERRKGVCSSWLSRLTVGDQVPIAIKTSSIRLPSDPNTPAIFVGPGTGVAPIRSFLQERQYLLNDDDDDDAMKAEDNLCFFGCRNKGKDWLFGKEWKEMIEKGQIQCHLAASRDQEKKIYVQDLIAEQGDQVWDILFHRKGYLYICGSSGKMPQAVRDGVLKIAGEKGNKTEEEAESFITQLEIQGRWLEECWS